MKKKKSMFSILGILLVLSLSFASGASASQQDQGRDSGGGGTVNPPPKTCRGFCDLP